MAHHNSAQIQFVRRIVFGDYETPEALARSISAVKRMRCERVMLFESHGHIEPAHLDHEEALRRADAMRTTAAAFRAAGIGVGINNLCTVSMSYSPPPYISGLFRI